MKLKIIKLLNKNVIINNKNKLVLKNILLNNILIKNINKTNKVLNNKLILKEINKNNWQIIIYNYNKNIEVNIIINDILTIKLLNKVINLNNNKVLISKPIFKHSINKLHIKYYYYNINLSVSLSGIIIINRDINYYNNSIVNIINNINKLSDILSYYYNKEVIIEPIKLSYIYLNNDIFSNYISYLINNKNIINNKLNIEIIIKNYINIINNIIPNINNIISNFNYTNNLPINLLKYKYLMGWSIQLKGKLSKIDNRTILLNIINGTFKNKYNRLYKFNYIPSNHYISNLFNINKDGKYNIKIILNYI